MKVFSTFKRPKTERPPELKNAVWSKTGGRCHYCGCVLVPFGTGRNSFTIDHIVALRNGGTNDIDNLVPACMSCNCKKGAR